MRRATLSIALAGMLAVLLLASAGISGAAPAAPPAPPAAGPPNLTDAKAYALIDPRDGELLAAKAPDRKLPIASATKLMTAYVALQRLKLKERIPAPGYQATDAESLLGLRKGEKLSVRDLMYALVLESANDAAEALAVGVSGSVPAFVAEMNEAALALGLTRTHFSTPVGLDEPGNYSSARDLTTLAAELLENPFFAKVADTPSATLKTGDQPRQIGTRVLLLNSVPFVTGIKTGHTLDAGYVLVGSGEKNGTTLISAVLGTPSEGARDADTLALLRYGFSQFTPETPVEKGAEFDGPDLDHGRGTLTVEAARGIATSIRAGQQIETEVDVPSEIKGAVEDGQRIGEVRVTVDGRPAGSSPLLAAESVGEAGLIRKGISALDGPVVLLPIGALILLAGLFMASGRRPHRPHRPHLRDRRSRPVGSDWPGSLGTRRQPQPPAPAQQSRPDPGPAEPTGGPGVPAAPPHAAPPAAAPPAGSDRRDPGSTSDGNGGGPRVRARKAKREKGPRTPAERERMRQERMERRSRQRAKRDGEGDSE